MSQLYSLHIKRIEGVVWAPGIFHRNAPRLYVQVSLDKATVHRTRDGKKELAPVWDEVATLKTDNPDSVLSLNVRHKSTLCKGPTVGRTEVTVHDLLKQSQSEDVSLRSKTKGGEDLGDIVVRLAATDLGQAAALADEQADEALARGGVVPEEGSTRAWALQGVDAASGVAAQQKDVLGLFKEVARKIGKLKEFGDDIAKLHPYANVAWKLITALYSAIHAQWETDKELVHLVKAMHDVYSFVDDVSFLKEKLQRLEGVVIDILNQTVECVVFIREYTGTGFYGRVVTQAWSSRGEKITALEAAFNALKYRFDHGLSIQTAFISTKILEDVGELIESDRLRALNAVVMNASSRPLCLPGTRTALLDYITEWALMPSSENVLWLHGTAGGGKSTISTSIRQRFDRLGRLGAFLFFDRNNRVQSDPNAVICTLASHLASFDSAIRASICRELQANTSTVLAPMESQWERLILHPLTSAKDRMGGPVIIILDALDECGDAVSRNLLLSTFVKRLALLPSVFRFLITSRPLPDIERAFLQTPNLKATVTPLNDARWPVTKDIKLYISALMDNVRADHKRDPRWPGEAAIQRLTDQSQGLFIWAKTAMALMESAYKLEDQLD